MTELVALQEVEPEVRRFGARLVALTPELQRYTRGVQKRLKLSFDILSDFHLPTTKQFRLLYVLPDYLRDLYKSFGNALDRFHGEPEYLLPLPARYVIDTSGIIHAADVNAGYTIRPEPADTVKFLATLTR
jgi:peroxiredoxin